MIRFVLIITAKQQQHCIANKPYVVCRLPLAKAVGSRQSARQALVISDRKNNYKAYGRLLSTAL
jgi:hypothetical protein